MKNSRIYDVTRYGAVGDGVSDNTETISKLIDSIEKYGGTLYFPAGEYVTGTVFLRSNFTIYLDEGATLLGSTDHERYPMIEGISGFTRHGHWGLVSALDAENIAVVGKGRIDARGYSWWETVKGDYVRPRTLSFISCKNVLIEGITVVNSPCWTVHPVCCDGVTVRGVSIINPYDSPNTDGINPESCSDVLIENCYIDVGDDCVTLKSGTETDELLRSRPCRNITVRNCRMAHGHGGVVIGSEMSGGVSDVVVRDCTFGDTERGIRIKTRRGRGGYVKHVSFENITMERIGAAITVNEYYRHGELTLPHKITFDTAPQPVNELTPVISDLGIKGIMAENTLGVGVYMYGLPELPISDITISDVTLNVVGQDGGFPAISAYDRKLSNGEGIFLENTERITLNNVNVRSVGEELTVINSKEITINGRKI